MATLCWAGAARAQAPRVEVGPTKQTTLGNGLRVVVQEDHAQPLVAVVVSYGVGSRDQRRGYNGLAHLVEHLTFRGSRHLAPHAALTLPTQSGATYVNATTTRDDTTYTMELPSHALELALWIESDRMAFTLENLKRKAFRAERDVVAEELAAKGGVAIDFWAHVERALFPGNHPYYPELHQRTLDEVGSLRLAHAQWFFQWGYRPANANLAIVGDVDAEKALGLVAKYFADIENPRVAFQRATAAPVAFAGTLEMTVAAPVFRESVTMLWPAPSHEDPAYPALLLAASVLSGSEGARLNGSLAQRGLARHVFIEYRELDLMSFVAIECDVALKQKPGVVARVIEDELARLQRSGLTEAELSSVRRSATRSTMLANESLRFRAEALAHSLRAADLYDVNRELARLYAVRPDDVQRAAARYLPLDRRLVAYLKQAERAPGTGRVVRRKGSLGEGRK